jgi:ABC-type dipeptide/oligopeptide/nickel transport system permease component
MPIPWMQIANTLAKISSIVITGKDLSDQMRKLRRYQERTGQTDPAMLERLQQLDKAIEMQAQLNSQYNTQMELMKSVLENFQKSLRTMWVMLLLSLVLSAAAILIALLK